MVNFGQLVHQKVNSWPKSIVMSKSMILCGFVNLVLDVVMNALMTSSENDLLLDQFCIVGQVICLYSMILNLKHDFVLEYDLEFESSWFHIMPWKTKDDHQIRIKMANKSYPLMVGFQGLESRLKNDSPNFNDMCN